MAVLEDILDSTSGGSGSGSGVNLEPFNRAISEWINPLIQQNVGVLGQTAQQMGGISQQFGRFAQGEDPVLAAQRTRAMEGVRGQLARRGLGGSSVATNELARINQGFNEQILGRRDVNLQQQAGALQGTAGLLGAQTGMTGEFAQNLLADPTLRIAMQAAKTAGSDGGGKK